MHFVLSPTLWSGRLVVLACAAATLIGINGATFAQFGPCPNFLKVNSILKKMFRHCLNCANACDTKAFQIDGEVKGKELEDFCRMRSKGSRFTLGVSGLMVCSLDIAFMFATVRNRPRAVPMAVPMVSSAKGVTFGGSICPVASFRVAGAALRDIRKSFCVAGTILLRRVQKMRCSFRGRRGTLDVCIVAGAAL